MNIPELLAPSASLNGNRRKPGRRWRTVKRTARFVWVRGRRDLNAWAGAAVVVLALACAHTVIQRNEARAELAEAQAERDGYRRAEALRQADAAARQKRCHGPFEKDGFKYEWCVFVRRGDS